MMLVYFGFIWGYIIVNTGESLFLHEFRDGVEGLLKTFIKI